jgi:dTDP-4-dehydrorhamnose reductase
MADRYVITGSRGQLGRCLVRTLTDRAAAGDVALVAALSHAELDVADPGAVSRTLESLSGGRFDVLVNAAAYNQVDRCEGEGWSEAVRVNARGPGVLAIACEKLGARLVHVSTDYVFSGGGDAPLREDAKPAPRTAYGRSKQMGEQAVLDASSEALIVRTSWVFGPGRNFVGAILRQARLRRSGEASGPLRVVDDQRGCPTSAADLAEGIVGLVAAIRVGADSGGFYHLCNAPSDRADADDASAPTWWDFARAILDETGHADLGIERVTTREMMAPAPRPAYSVLSCERAAALGVRLRPWRAALTAYLRSADLAVTRALTDPPVREETRA